MSSTCHNVAEIELSALALAIQEAEYFLIWEMWV